MSGEIAAYVTEIESIARELHELGKKTKELRNRKKELEGLISKYLVEVNRPGFRSGNLLFMLDTKEKAPAKKKAEQKLAIAEVLQRHGIQGDAMKVIEEIDAAKKGDPVPVSKLTMKAAGLFD